jgi:chorismate mutase / prephenate dehydratase
MSLLKLRHKIDAIDERVVALLNDRARLSKSIGEEKIRNNQKIYSPDRETQVFP